jgi:hypothetical protein
MEGIETSSTPSITPLHRQCLASQITLPAHRTGTEAWPVTLKATTSTQILVGAQTAAILVNGIETGPRRSEALRVNIKWDNFLLHELKDPNCHRDLRLDYAKT